MLNGMENNNTSGKTIGASAIGTADTANDGMMSLGFGTPGLMTARGDGELEMALSKSMNKIITDAGIKGIDISLLLRSTFTELAYSSLVLSKKVGNETMYFVIILEETGDYGMTTGQYREILDNKRYPFVTTDAIDNVLDAVILEALDVESGFQLGGMVIPHGHDLIEDEQLVRYITVESVNSIILESKLRSGEVKDINLAEETSKLNGFLSMTYNTLTMPYVDGLGRKTSVCFGVDLSTEVFGNKQQTSPNEKGSGRLITSIKGRLNFLPEEYSEPVMGGVASTKVGFHPQIVISAFDAPIPTLSHLLIGITTAAVVAKDDNWIKPVLDGATNPIGELNRVVNVANEKNPKAVDINAAGISVQEKASRIKTLAALDPIISMDATAFGEKSAVMSVMTAAAGGDVGACNLIIETANTATNGAFPMNFNIGEIFASNMIIIPDGEWTDKNGGDRTVDDVDTCFTLGLGTNALSLVQTYMYGELGLAQDAFTDRCDLLNTIEINAAIRARKMRMTFSSAFMTTLLNAMSNAGLNPRFESTGILAKPTGLGFTSGMFTGAGIRTVNGFASYQQNGFADNGRFGMGFRR